MKRLSNLLLVIGVSFFITMTLFLGNGLAEVGVTDDSIKIGATMDLTGPSAFAGVNIKKAIDMYFHEINDAGGIFGRKLVLVAEDDGYSVSKSIANFKKLVKRDKVFCMIANNATEQMIAQIPMIEKEKIPVIAPHVFDDIAKVPPKRYLIPVNITTNTDQAKYLVWYIYDKLGIKKPKIGVIYQEGAFCKNPMLAVTDYAKKLGFNIIINEVYSRGAIDLSSQVLKTKRAGVDHVIVLGMLRSCASAVKEMKKLSWKPSVYFFLPPVDPQLINLLGEDSLWPKRIIGDIGTPLPDTDMAGPREVNELIKKYDPKYIPMTYTIAGYGYAKVLVEGLKRAGKDLTREKLIDAFETFKGFDNGVHAPLTYTPTLRGGDGKCLVYEVKKVNGAIKWVLIEKWVDYKKF